jgi:hypothetical protein
MNNFKKISINTTSHFVASFTNEELILDIKRQVKIETHATLAVIERLKELYSRRLHLEMGYGSLHEFCVVELGYSDGAAYRRISAMKLCEELLKAIECKSTRECEKLIKLKSEQ